MREKERRSRVGEGERRGGGRKKRGVKKDRGREKAKEGGERGDRWKESE